MPPDNPIAGDGEISLPPEEPGTMPDEPIASQPTRSYGPVEQADATRQAQHSFSNDTPTDVNFNAVVSRSQSLTVDALGKGFTAAQERRQVIADAMMQKAIGT